jgi:hypothetical protein
LVAAREHELGVSEPRVRRIDLLGMILREICEGRRIATVNFTEQIFCLVLELLQVGANG